MCPKMINGHFHRLNYPSFFERNYIQDYITVNINVHLFNLSDGRGNIFCGSELNHFD